MRRAAALAFACALAGCGGGRVDPEFTEPIVEQKSSGKDARSLDTTPPRSFDKPKLVVIRADWCGFCRAAQPAIDTAYGEFSGSVDLVVLDVTDESSTDDASRIASHEGVRSFFASYHGRTPTVGVFTAPEVGRLVRGSLEDPATLSRELAFAVEHFRAERMSQTPSDAP